MPREHHKTAETMDVPQDGYGVGFIEYSIRSSYRDLCRVIPGYDEWKITDPADDCCEFCGIHERSCRDGWQPDCCTGECKRSWRDPDYERDLLIEDREFYSRFPNDDPF